MSSSSFQQQQHHKNNNNNSNNNNNNSSNNNDVGMRTDEESAMLDSTYWNLFSLDHGSSTHHMISDDASVGDFDLLFGQMNDNDNDSVQAGHYHHHHHHHHHDTNMTNINTNINHSNINTIITNTNNNNNDMSNNNHNHYHHNTHNNHNHQSKQIQQHYEQLKNKGKDDEITTIISTNDKKMMTIDKNKNRTEETLCDGSTTVCPCCGQRLTTNRARLRTQHSMSTTVDDVSENGMIQMLNDDEEHVDDVVVVVDDDDDDGGGGDDDGGTIVGDNNNILQMQCVDVPLLNQYFESLKNLRTSHQILPVLKQISSAIDSLCLFSNAAKTSQRKEKSIQECIAQLDQVSHIVCQNMSLLISTRDQSIRNLLLSENSQNKWIQSLLGTRSASQKVGHAVQHSGGWYAVIFYLTRDAKTEEISSNILVRHDKSKQESDQVLLAQCIDSFAKFIQVGKNLDASMHTVFDSFLKLIVKRMYDRKAEQSIIELCRCTQRFDIYADMLIQSEKYAECVQLICDQELTLADQLFFCLNHILQVEYTILETYQRLLHRTCRMVQRNPTVYGDDFALKLFDFMLSRHGMSSDVSITERIIQLLLRFKDDSRLFRKCLTSMLADMFTSDKRLLFDRLHRFIGYKRIVEFMVAGVWINLTVKKHEQNNKLYQYREIISQEEQTYVLTINNHLRVIASSVFNMLYPTISKMRSSLSTDFAQNQVKQRALVLSSQYRLFGRESEFEKLKQEIDSLGIEDAQVQLNQIDAKNSTWIDNVLVHPVSLHSNLMDKLLLSFADVSIQCVDEQPSSTQSISTIDTTKGTSQKLNIDPSQLSQTGLTGYNVFCSYKRDELKTTNPDFTYRQINSELGRLWKGMSEIDRQPFNDQARYNKVRKDQEKAPTVSPSPPPTPKRPLSASPATQTIQPTGKRYRPEHAPPTQSPSAQLNVSGMPMQMMSSPMHQQVSVNYSLPQIQQQLQQQNLQNMQALQQMKQQQMLQQAIQSAPSYPFQNQPNHTPIPTMSPLGFSTAHYTTNQRPTFSKEQRLRLRAQIYCLKNYISSQNAPAIPQILLAASAGSETALLLFERLQIQ